MKPGIFVGLSTIDLIYAVDSFPKANSKIVARSQEIFAGGPATNAAITFAYLGGTATLVTALGRHPLTSLVREDLQKFSVRLIDLHPRFDQVPVISSVYVNRAGERNVISANASRMGEVSVVVDDGLCEQAAVLLVDGHFMQACQLWTHAAQAHGCRVIFDGGSWKPGTEELLRSVDTAICSADFWPPGCSTEDDVMAFLRHCGVKNVAITHGASPIQFLAAGRSGHLPVPQVPLVDSMGAGDILHGAFCFYLSEDCGFVEALEAAVRVASESCRFHGTREWMRHFASTNKTCGDVIARAS